MGRSIETERMVEAAQRHRRLVANPLTPEQTDELSRTHNFQYRSLQFDEVVELTPYMLERLRYSDLSRLSDAQLQQVRDHREIHDRLFEGVDIEAEVRRLFSSREALDHSYELLDTVRETGTIPTMFRGTNTLLKVAAGYEFLDAGYENGTTMRDGQPMLDAEARIRALGYDDVTMYNMGPLSVGQSASNLQMGLVVDRTNPERPMIISFFRGTKDDPSEWRTPDQQHGYTPDAMSSVNGWWDFLNGNTIRSYDDQMKLFMAAAAFGLDPNDPDDRGTFDIMQREVDHAQSTQELMEIVRPLLPPEALTDLPENFNPEFVVLGHSYGSHFAGHFAMEALQRFPQLSGSTSLYLYGATPTWLEREQLELYQTMFRSRDTQLDSLDLSQMSDSQIRHELEQARERYRDVVISRGGDTDILTRLSPFIPSFERHGVPGVQINGPWGHMDYGASLLAEAIAERPLAIVQQYPNAGRDLLLRARADLTTEMDVFFDEILYLEHRGWDRMARNMQIRKAAITQSQSGDDAPSAVLLSDTGDVITPQLIEPAVPDETVKTSTDTTGIVVQDAGANGDLDNVLQPSTPHASVGTPSLPSQ